MAGLRSVCLLLEKHRDVICEDVNVDEVVPDLVAKGILNAEDKNALAAKTSDRTKGELLVSLLGKKGFAAFQEFCHVLEKTHPHLITCFLMDFAAGGVTPSVTSSGDTESQYSLDSATREQHRIRASHDSVSLYGTLSRRRSSVRRNRSTATPPPPLEPPDSDPGGSGTLPSGSTVGSVSESSEPHLTEVLEEPVTEEPGGERVVWEFHQVSLNRVPGYGFGIAVSGGRDNPHFTTGDPSIAISDVLKAGPAEGKLHVNDRVLSANGISLENVDYGTAVQVLKDSGAVVHLYVKRRVVLPASLEPQTYKLVLNKAKKKDDFGIVLGCHIYVKEITGRSASSSEGDAGGLQEGDTVLRINHVSTDGLTLKEARKLLDTTKDRLGLTVRRDPAIAAAAAAKNQRLAEAKLSPPRGVHQEERNNYSNQNLYVQPPTRGSDRSDYGRIQPQSHQQPSRHGQLTNGDDKSNLNRQNGRGRGPLMEVSLSQLDQPATPLMRNHLTPGSEELPPPPRPPVTRDNVNGAPMTNGVNGHHPTYGSDYGEMSKTNYDHSPKSKANVPDPRFVSFQKDGSVGIRLAGGNETGIFVTAVQSGSPAALQGLQPGDKIIKVNGMEMKGVTREEAVLFLLSLQDQIDLIVQYRKDEHDDIVASQRGDSFYIRTHFNHEQTGKNELSFRKGDIFHVVDTLNMGVVGAWQVFRIGRNNEETQKGVVPNKSRAEELATAQFNAAKKVQSSTETRSRFFSRRRRQGRSKSLGKDHWEDVVFSDAVSKFPAYERVALRGCSFVRPVVLFGGVSDLARDQLLKDMPDKFAAPQLDMADDSRSSKHSGIIRLSAIRELVELGRHALLDVTPNAVDRLNYAQLYPICIFLRAESKHIIKEVRTARAAEKPQQKSSKKMFDQCVKLEKLWSHVFTASITMTDADGWYRRVKELIDKQQNAPIWMSETKPGESLSDDYLFPMTSRLSFVSSPESDVEGTETSPTRSPASSAAAATSSSGSCDQLQQPRLGRSSSDPSLAPEDLMQAPGPPPYSPYSQHQQPQSLHDDGLGRSAASISGSGGKRGSHGSDSRYGFSPTRYPTDADDYPSLPVSATSRHHPPPAPASPRSPYQTLPHDFRPNGLVQQHPVHSQHHSPPSVDRTSKPVSPGGHGGTRSYGRASGGQMRNYMMNGGGAPEDNYMNTVVNGNGSGNGNYAPALDRHRGGPYDGSPTSYDSYQRFNNMHDDLKARSLPPQELLLSSAADGTAGPSQQLPLTNGSAAGGRSHDPYRFTRSTAQPSAPSTGDATIPPPSQTHRSYSGRFELKPPPPPKNSISLQSHLQQYKPIPPPKPKGFRGPPASTSDSYRRPADSRRTPDSRGSREDFAGFLATNGGLDDGGGFDSGHGSSLDRNGESQRTYMNMKPASSGGQTTHYLNMPPTSSSSSSKDPLLDLSNRDQRGSAFELYKKPHIESRYPSAAYNVEHTAGAR